MMLEYRSKKRSYEAKLEKQRQIQLDKINNANLANMLLQRNTVSSAYAVPS